MMGRRNTSAVNEDHVTIWGINPVEEFLHHHPSAIVDVTVLPSFGKRKRQKALLGKLQSCGMVPGYSDDFRQLHLPAGAIHQGVAARVLPVWQCEIQDLPTVWGDELPLLLCCDEITDPGNLGAIIRSAAAFGVHAIIVSHKNSAAVNGTVVKASAGTIVHLKICYVVNMARALETLKALDVWVAALDARGASDIWQQDLKLPLALVLGAEGRGIRPIVLRHCDFSVKIPHAREIESLNVASACTAALYECLRQRSLE